MVNNRYTAKKAAFLGLFAAAAIALSAAENMVPPLPFMPPGAKLGLSNVITMLLSVNGMLPEAILISLAKGGFSLLTRGVSAGIMSACGGLLSSLVVFLLAKCEKFGYAGLGIAGAVSHNMAQLAVSCIIIGKAAVYYMPFLIIFAAVSGTLTALILKYITPYAERFGILK